MAILFVSDKVLAFFLDATLENYRDSISCTNAEALAFMICKRYCDAVMEHDPKMINKDMLERVRRLEMMMQAVDQGLEDYHARTAKQ